MKAKDLRSKSAKELSNTLDDLRKKLETSVVEYRTKEVKNIKQINSIKKDIARVMTIMREAQLQGETK
ncbi:MAG TPA: 50S ribosomal protein L29 [Candidatus Saccharibacteria bacterium]|nr:50S ribosomal protein L29 [Candidatus Saccharibacteria bacterium]HMT39585.1 50S ribosomal protein L29 [Candidatus Saccharibacteria bacterium]